MVAANNLRMQRETDKATAAQIEGLWFDIARLQKAFEWDAIQQKLIRVVERAGDFSNPSRRLVEIEKAIAASPLIPGKVAEAAVGPWKKHVAELPTAEAKVEAAKRAFKVRYASSYMKWAASRVILENVPMLQTGEEKYSALCAGSGHCPTEELRHQYARELLALATIFTDPKSRLSAAYVAVNTVSRPCQAEFDFSLVARTIGEMGAEVVLANINTLKPERRVDVLNQVACCVDHRSHVGKRVLTRHRWLKDRLGRQAAR
ncbi:MAG: hypothetical protein EYC62_05755 [Alphaproteobacteria bacterium]|nr:MAG: hypothetical protein EYC62_05755 [Alphaproteobacteria bacterium]